MDDITDEIDALKSLYCKPNEYSERKDAFGHHITVQLHVDDNLINMNKWRETSAQQKGDVRMVVLLSADYPTSGLVEVCIQCQFLPEDTLERIQKKLWQHSQAACGQPVLLELCCLAQELLDEEVKAAVDRSACEGKTKSRTNEKCTMSSSNNGTSIESCVGGEKDHRLYKTTKIEIAQTSLAHATMLLQLDHMRSKHTYTKLIRRWVKDLNLSGRLIFSQRLILIILQGQVSALKEYVIRNRTMNVDVDSRGHNCKERMLTVLYEGHSEAHKRLADFQVLEDISKQDIDSFFHSWSMEDLYKEFIKPLH